MNTTVNATHASACYALKSLLDPEIPNSQGVLDTAEVSAPPGTVVNAVFPASVAARANTCQRIVDVIFGALAGALPDRVPAAANGANTTAVFAGTDPDTGVPYVYLETLGGGMGARPDRDGKDAVQIHMTNTSNLPVEAIEMEYPLLVEEYGLVPTRAGRGAGGAGSGFAASCVRSVTTARSTGSGSGSGTSRGGSQAARRADAGGSRSSGTTARSAPSATSPGTSPSAPTSAWSSRPPARAASGLPPSAPRKRSRRTAEAASSARVPRPPLPVSTPGRRHRPSLATELTRVRIGR